MLTAITREINADFGNCELTFLPRVEIDVDLARRQHERYESALASLGCEIVVVPTEPGLADSVFIEDTAMVLDEIAILLRPGAPSRRREVAGVEAVLEKYRPLATIQAPGTVDGGDLLLVGKTLFAGLSTRSNREGIDQLRNIVTPYGYSVVSVETAQCLHLTSAVTRAGPGMLLINPDWIDASVFAEYDLIDIDQQEPHGANGLLVGGGFVYPASFPRTMDSLVARGINVIPVDLSELQKAEGATTCCSLILTAS
jgi:dimethylargininase